MFDYSDPAGRAFLTNPEVQLAYRRTMARFYDTFAQRVNSAFTWLEAMGQLSGGAVPTSAAIEWSAFPLTAIATDRQIDRDRFRLQDEYVEWRVETAGVRPRRITFVTQFPEYYEAFASIGSAALIAAVKDAITGADPTIVELFGASSTENVDALTPTARSNLFRTHMRDNPWNNGVNGILCLGQPANTMAALFNLVAECGILNPGGPPEDTCALVGGACGPGRSSDPRICAATQTAVRNNQAVSLVDPAGIKIVELTGQWQLNGTELDINDPAQNQHLWTIAHNGRRAVLEIPLGLTLNQEPITTGAQVSRVLKVAADVVTAPDGALPAWARTGSEGSRGGPTSLL
jgi:hypothetical protein